MEWVLLVLAGGGAGTYGAWRLREARADRQQRDRELEQARQIAEEDVTVFGEELQRLGVDVGERQLDRPARDAYQLALDAYERAKWDAPRLRHADQISALVDTLGAGRYALACVRAAVEGRPPPERRVPCFFNPQHGPSVRDVEWTPSGRGTRRVPACGRCSTQVRERERPEIRMVRIGDRRVPYWEAGSVSLPYSHGYFAGGSATGPVLSWLSHTAIAGDWDIDHYGDHPKRPGGAD